MFREEAFYDNYTEEIISPWWLYADEILNFANKIGADLIAMGSHGLTGVLRVLMGSVSRKVVDHAKCPVLIVRIPDKTMAAAGMLET
jgi:hypothetical protein